MMVIHKEMFSVSDNRPLENLLAFSISVTISQVCLHLL